MNLQSTPLISIVIPVFNRTELLRETINSVVAQTYENWELIIVDDGSTEDVERAVTHNIGHNLKLLRQANQGNAAARNKGLRHARGQYLICLDSDDIWQEEMLARCLFLLEDNEQVDVVYTLVQMIDYAGNKLPLPIWPETERGNFLESLVLGHPILPSSALFRRRCLTKWGGFKPGMDDWELWLRWSLNGCLFDCIEQPLLHYRLHDENFALQFHERRSSHFAMLDSIYRREGLPERIVNLRDQAYAIQHYRFAILAWQLGSESEGKTEFALAVRLFPGFLSDVDSITQLACAHQGRAAAGTQQYLNFDEAERTVVCSLEEAYDDGAVEPSVYEEAMAWNYFALAHIAYSVAHDSERARRFLRKSISIWPAILLRSDSATWLGRFILGYETVQTLKSAVGRS